MSRRFVCLIALFVSLLGEVPAAEAQVVQRIRTRRAAARAAMADPNAAYVPEQPMLGGPVARRIAARLGLGVPPQPVQPDSPATYPVAAGQPAMSRNPVTQPTPAAGLGSEAPPWQPGVAQAHALGTTEPTLALKQATALTEPRPPRLTASELAVMDTAALQTALSNFHAELSNELARFSSAASWQTYLALPSGLVNEAAIDPAELRSALDRFDTISQASQYAQITRLESFAQAQGILRELSSRIIGPQLIAPHGAALPAVPGPSEGNSPLAEEPLPAPRDLPEPKGADGERSILKTSSSRQ